MLSDPTRLPPLPAPRPRPELLGNPDPNWSISARRFRLDPTTLYHWFPPSFPGHVVAKALLSRPTLTVPQVAQQLWVTPQTVLGWFPPEIRVQFVRFLLLHGSLSLAQVARRLGTKRNTLDAWVPPDQRFRIVRELFKKPDPNFAEAARKFGLSKSSLYTWFPPSFPGHVIVKVLLIQPWSVGQIAWRLWITPETVLAWIPPEIQARLVRFLVLRAGLSVPQVERRLHVSIPRLCPYLSRSQLVQIARQLLLRHQVPMDRIADSLGVQARVLRRWFPRKQRQLLARELLIGGLSLPQVASRLGVRLATARLWFPRQERAAIITELLLRTDLDLVQLSKRLGFRPFHLQRMSRQEQLPIIKELLLRTSMSPAQVATRLGVSIDILYGWVPSLKQGDSMSKKIKPRRIGYARVSTLDQDPAHQIKALKDAGCARCFTDQVSGRRWARPELIKALNHVQAGDTLVVWKLDRLGRSLQHLIRVINDLDGRGVHVHCLTQEIHTETPMGRMLFHLMGAFAHFERDLISERTKLAAMRRKEKNQHWGRPSQFHDPKRVNMAQRLLRSELPRQEVARRLGITCPVLYKWFPGGKAENFGKGVAHSPDTP